MIIYYFNIKFLNLYYVAQKIYQKVKKLIYPEQGWSQEIWPGGSEFRENIRVEKQKIAARQCANARCDVRFHHI